jgi:hypothetical protein
MTTESEVRNVVREESHRAASGEAMRETWFLDRKRLEAAGLKCYNKGMAGSGDTTAPGIYAIVYELRSPKDPEWAPTPSILPKSHLESRPRRAAFFGRSQSASFRLTLLNGK